MKFMTIEEFINMKDILKNTNEMQTIIFNDTWENCNSIGLAYILANMPSCISFGYILNGEINMYSKNII